MGAEAKGGVPLRARGASVVAGVVLAFQQLLHHRVSASEIAIRVCSGLALWQETLSNLASKRVLQPSTHPKGAWGGERTQSIQSSREPCGATCPQTDPRGVLQICC